MHMLIACSGGAGCHVYHALRSTSSFANSAFASFLRATACSWSVAADMFAKLGTLLLLRSGAIALCSAFRGSLLTACCAKGLWV
jgi:hypothetical protein